MLMMGLAGLARLVLAADPTIHSIDIPAQDLGTALLKFAAVTHQQIAFDPKLVAGYESTALSGSCTLEEGLHAIIGAAPLVTGTTPSGVITLAAAPAGLVGWGSRASAEESGAPSNAASLASASVPASQAPARVIVSADRGSWAQRGELEPRISEFVNQIAGSNNDPEGLARWHKEVCPLVSGLPRPAAEFILARVSEVARAAGAPLAGEKCRANLYILVTAQPERLLRAMGARNRPFTFGLAPASVIDEFISTPRAVRVWYHTSEGTPEGMPLQNVSGPNWNGTLTMLEPESAQGSAQSPPPDNQTAMPRAGAATWAQATHLSVNMVWNIFRVFVIVDKTRLQGASRGQIADYVAMLALAQIKADGPAGDSATILSLFDAAPQAAPAGMSDWDQAYLKALYTTEQKSNLQRTLIVREMVREVSP
jgi:hypothetical protein